MRFLTLILPYANILHIPTGNCSHRTFANFLIFEPSPGLLVAMSEKVTILSREEMREILRAVYKTLRYALQQARTVEPQADPSFTVISTIERAVLSVEAAFSSKSSKLSIKGHCANATARLRTALQRLDEMPVGSPTQSAAARAIHRAVALISPLTQDEGPYELIPRKKRISRRHNRSRRRRLPHFKVSISDTTYTKFFTGFDKRITSGGLFIATYNLYPEGSLILLTANLPADRCIVGSGTVLWLREHNENTPDIPPGMGVSLNNLTQSATIEIDRYLENNESIFYEAVS